MLVLEHGKPMIFGKDRDKGIRLNGLQPEVVTIGENGVTEADLLVHDERPTTADRVHARADVLARLPGPGRVVRGRRAADPRPDDRATRSPDAIASAARATCGVLEGGRDLDRRVTEVAMPARSAASRTSPATDTCENCGARPAHVDIPQPATTSTAAPRRAPRRRSGSRARTCRRRTRRVDEAIARMQDDGVDCLLVVDGGRLVGIFTDRDAIVKVAGRPARGPRVARR